MKATNSRRVTIGASCVALAALILAASGATALTRGVPASSGSSAGSIVTIRDGAVRGLAESGGYVFKGLPYAAPPIGNLRWRPPEAPAAWKGVRDATQFGPSCPQAPSPFAPPGPESENCLYLNVYTSALHTQDGKGRPVLVWIHGGGFTQDGARNYDGSKLAADGIVVVTIGYRLGALGFLAHSALASRPGGPSGNYGLMDQQAALRWVQQNIAQFGGNPHSVTIAGQSAGGVSVLEHLISPGSRGLFQRAIVESGAFALNQEPLAAAEMQGKAFAVKAGCPGQTAQCLRHLSVAALVKNFPGAAIPGTVDGKVITESLGSALSHGRFTHVPILDGINQNEELIFVAGLGLAVSGGQFVPVPKHLTNKNYQSAIASVLGVPAARAKVIAAQYPLEVYGSPYAGLSTLVSDANFACTALQVDSWTSKQAPTFAYEFNDGTAPQRFAPPGALPPIATHSSEIQYLFDQPNTPVHATLNTKQEQLADSMRTAWASFAATGDPSSTAVPWSSFDRNSSVLSLESPKPRAETAFSSIHHCSFWAAG
jgi:para-nitrobenzyl esterase